MVIFQVQDYSQYYLDLPSANSAEAAREEKRKAEESLEDKVEQEVVTSSTDWALLYNFTDYYGFNQRGSAAELHQLAESFTIQEGLPLFIR